MDQLWDGRPPATAMKAVQVYISQLRKVLGEGLIDTQPGGYRLRIDPDSLDAARFEDLLTRGRALLRAGDARQAGVVLHEALALWRGPPLAEFRYTRSRVTRSAGWRSCVSSLSSTGSRPTSPWATTTRWSPNLSQSSASIRPVRVRSGST
jgi:hypothetical protein